MRTALHWFRRDLRLADNPALHAAIRENDRVIGCFIFDPKILRSPDVGAPRVAFLLESLRLLREQFIQAGAEFVIRQGDVMEEMALLFKDAQATHLYFNRDYEPYARARDKSMEKMAREHQVEVQSFKDGMIFEPHEILKPDGTPYIVFTPYRKSWEKHAISPPLPKPTWPKYTPHHPLRTEEIPEPAKLGFQLQLPLWPSGEARAQSALEQFLKQNAGEYGSQRDLPGTSGTSQLSPHLRFGTISPRSVAWAAIQAKRANPLATKGIDVFLSEITWRDFYRAILWHFPHAATSAFKPQYEHLKWENNTRFFQAWCEGKTGYPIVDAGMRQLNSTGWMHNRVRMIVATFLTKDLLIDWKWGERYFMQKLFDGDLASNNGGWQWSASTGTDAQPYFRIFNPTSQAEKFDPEGKYVKQFLPDRDSLDYPEPIVDHAVQREKALAMFKTLAA